MNVFIGCAAQDKIDLKYINLAHRVAEYLAKNNYDLVFGAYSKSMMGECYKVFIENNKKVISCVPKSYLNDLNDLEQSEHVIFDNTIERLNGIYKRADLIVFLPGGIGTLSEIMSIIEETKSIKCDKRIVLFNFENFYEDIIKFIMDKIKLKFININNINEMISVVNTEEELFEFIGGNL